MLLTGDAGIGNSSLLEAAARLARSVGCRVLRTSGVEAEALLPFAGLHQLLRPLIAASAELPGPQRLAIAAAFGDESGPAAQPFLVGLATLNLLAEAANTRPLVVLVDDVQWLDKPSHDALAFVARRIGGDAVAIVAVLRSGHDGPLLGAGLLVHEVTRVNESAAREILRRGADGLSRQDRERILLDAMGNPLALVELPLAWRTRLTSSRQTPAAFLPRTARLEKAIAARIDGLPGQTRDVLLIAATEHADSLREILAAATVLSGPPMTVDALESAAAVGLLTFDQARLRFRHPLVRSAALQRESMTRRMAAHSAIAGVLHDEPYRRTWHRAHAVVGHDDDVATELEANVTVSLRRGAVSEAIWALERSAQLTTDPATRGRRLLLAAEHAFGLGRPDTVDSLLRAASLCPLSELDRARKDWLAEIFSDGIPGDAGRVHRLCDRAARSATAGDTGLALNLLLAAALRCWWSDTGPRARARVVDVTESLSVVNSDPRYVAALGVAEPVLRGRAVVDLLSRVVVEEVTDAESLRLLGMAAHAVGDSHRTVELLQRAEAKMREQGRLGLLPHVLSMQANARVSVGDWDRSAVAAAEGTRLAMETGQPNWTSGTLMTEAMAHALRRDTGTALELAARAQRHADSGGLNNILACVSLVRAFASLSTGRHGPACEELLTLFDPGWHGYHERESFNGVMFLAEAAVHCGRVPEARAVLARLEQIAAVTPSTLLHVQLHYARAVLADDAEAEALFAEALGSGDLVGWPWVRARMQLAQGTWLRRHRRAVEARSPLRAAHTVLSGLGATAWAEQARAELRAAGESAPGPTTAVHDLLSAQEMQIAQLAAEGLSNREIGQRLYLSPRTVGSHLYRIFPKLSITSRGQLARRLDVASAATSG